VARGTGPRLSSYIYGLRLRLGSDANPLRRWSLIQVRSRGTSGWSTCHSMKPRFASGMEARRGSTEESDPKPARTSGERPGPQCAAKSRRPSNRIGHCTSVAAAFGADNCGHHRRQRLDSCLQICTARGDPRLSRSHGVAGSPRTTSSYGHCVLIHEIPTARNRARSGFLADGRESRGANNLSVNALRYDPAIPGDGGSMR
jgi:hypothetical protein